MEQRQLFALFVLLAFTALALLSTYNENRAGFVSLDVVENVRIAIAGALKRIDHAKRTGDFRIGLEALVALQTIQELFCNKVLDFAVETADTTFERMFRAARLKVSSISPAARRLSGAFGEKKRVRFHDSPAPPAPVAAGPSAGIPGVNVTQGGMESSAGDMEIGVPLQHASNRGIPASGNGASNREGHAGVPREPVTQIQESDIKELGREFDAMAANGEVPEFGLM